MHQNRQTFMPANMAGKDAMSTALTAFTTGKKIGIYDSGCDVTPSGAVKGRDDVATVSHLWIFSQHEDIKICFNNMTQPTV